MQFLVVAICIDIHLNQRELLLWKITMPLTTADGVYTLLHVYGMFYKPIH